ncbi:phenylalanine--tRNA ligase subunit beta [Candidatus Saccharibacteria bacterium]|nr:phenylalanine--tRNA ligase subunit beta [Candidatus Saccharibacteria bacterium]
MIISRKWLEEFVDLSSITDEELAERIGSRLVEVEEVIKYQGKYDGIFIVEVKNCEKIKDSDHLHLVYIDDAGIMEKYAPNTIIARNSKGLIPVVCGAPNVHEGMLAAWIAPGATVPSTFNDQEPFVIGAKKLRGHQSYGMLAATDELDLGTDHEGILEIDADLDYNGKDDDVSLVGAPFAQIMGLDSTLLDIENKSLTHRPDCFGIIGFAREVAGIFGKSFRTPDYLLEDEIAKKIERLRRIDAGEWAKIGKNAVTSADGALSLDVSIEDSALCSRYNAIILESGLASNSVFSEAIKATPTEGSAAALAQFQHIRHIGVPLMLSGVRTINPIVDWSNYLMLLTGQPLHFFDYDKLLAIGGGKTAKITVRAARKGETLTLLNDKRVELDPRDTVITSNDIPVALAGVMGGLDTEVDDKTTRIVVESASFNLYRIRETSFRYGIFSEAVTRFTKGQPAALAEQVTLLAANKLRKNLGFGFRSQLAEAGKNATLPKITLRLENINALLGSSYSESEVEDTLQNVEFDAGWADNTLVVRPPYWRTDINITEDIIEEVGRLLGFDNLPLTLPLRDFSAPAPDEFGDFAKLLRDTLASYGGSDVLTYSFIHRDLLKLCQLPIDNAYEVINSISPELQVIRTRLLPSLLAKLEVNVRDLGTNFTLFEINQIYDKAWGLNNEGVPDGRQQLAIAQVNSDFYTLKYWLTTLLDSLNITNYQIAPLEDDLYTNHSAKIMVGSAELVRFGQIESQVATQFGVDTTVLAAEFLDLAVLQKSYQDSRITPRQRPINSKFPSAKRDISVLTPNTESFQQVAEVIEDAFKSIVGTDIEWQMSPLSIYDNADKKTTTFRLILTSPSRTLLSAEITDYMQVIEQVCASRGYQIV